MSRYPAYDNRDQQPLLWLGGYAFYAAHVIVLAYVVTLFVTTICQAFQLGFWFTWLPYSSEAVLRGQVWRLVSFGAVNPPSLSFVIDMFMIGWFGRELERYFGRQTFLFFYAGLYLLTPLVFTGIGLWQPMFLAGEVGAFALFIAFATLHPNMPIFFNLLAKWVAIVLVAIYTLMHLANRDLASLLSLACTAGFAYGFVRYQQGNLTLPRLRWPSRKPKLRVLPGGKVDPVERSSLSSSDKAVGEMDALLEKIARSGMKSLTAKERERLQQSREAILRKKGTPKS